MASTQLAVVGLSETIRALKRVNRELAAEAKDLVREGAKLVQADAKGRVRRRPGGGSYPRTAGMVRRRSNLKGSEVGLKTDRYPWAAGAEYGAKRAWVYGRVTTQGRLSRRQYAPWRGNQFVVRGRAGPGWIVQPAIRENLPRIERDLAAGIEDLYDQAFRQVGV